MIRITISPLGFERWIRSVICLSLLVLISACGGGGGGGGGAPASDPPPPPPTRVTLSGEISISPGSVVDGDVNDPNMPYNENDTVQTAQPLPNPVTLGGYLNWPPNTGYPGDSYSFGDEWDVFSISLVAGQQITLIMAEDPMSVVDLDLFLADVNGNVLAQSVSGTSAVETIPVAANGDYIVAVQANSGYSNYTLRIGNSTASAPLHESGRLTTSDSFVPGEIIVKFRDEPLTANSASRSAGSRAALLGLQMKAGGTADRAMLLGLGDVAARQATITALGSSTKAQPKFPLRFKDSEQQLKHDTLMVIKALRKRADVLYAEPNYIHTASAVPTDPLYSSQWHYPLINLPSAWDLEKGDSGVTVAIVDTGVLMSHPDLRDPNGLWSQFSADGGYDFISSPLISSDGDGIDPDPNDSGDNPNSFGSSSFHGTHVAGTVAAATVFNTGAFPPGASNIGVTGIAPGVKIMPVRVMGIGGGTSYDIVQGVRYAAGLSNDSPRLLSATDRADVINLSIGRLGGYSQFEQDTYTAVRVAGVIVVAAAGNENSSTPSYPASYAGVISVAAVDRNKQKTYYSNFGAAVDVAAPGGDMRFDVDGDGFPDGVLSTLADDSGGTAVSNYNAISGTSMASPHVAGVVALMKSVHSGLTPDEVDIALSSGAIVEDIGDVGRDDLYGYGLIDANKAVTEALALAGGPPPTPTPQLAVLPSALNFGDSNTTTTLNAVNGGSGLLKGVSAVSSNPEWLAVVGESVNAEGVGTYRATVSRNHAALSTPGIYQSQITFNSDAGSVVVPVTVQVVTVGVNEDAGFHYVLLIDASDFTVLDQWAGPVQGGSYSYQFNDVSVADNRQYYIIGGTDLNNDIYICDAGEACGGYFSLANLVAIGADGPHTGLDFVTGFDSGVQANATVFSGNGIRVLRRQQIQRQTEISGLQRNR